MSEKTPNPEELNEDTPEMIEQLALELLNGGEEEQKVLFDFWYGDKIEARSIDDLFKKAKDITVDSIWEFATPAIKKVKGGKKLLYECITIRVIPPAENHNKSYFHFNINEELLKTHFNIEWQSDIDQLEKIAKKTVFDVQITMHAARNIVQIGKEFDPQIPIKFERENLWEPNVDGIGISLGETQHKLMEGILKSLTECNYDPGYHKTIEEIMQQNNLKQRPAAYKHFKVFPTLKIKQSDLFRASNIVHGREEERAIEAIKWFQETMFCFYYDRLKMENGEVVYDKTGAVIKEPTYTVDKLFTIQNIYHPGSSILNYYEITPSVIFLDQRENYFLMFPSTWRDEVKSKLGLKKISQYTFGFLFFLRYQFEQKRRANQLFEIKDWHWTTLAKAINLPEKHFIKKKGNIIKTLQDAFFAAQNLGYTTKCELKGDKVYIKMNEQKYYKPEKPVHKKVQSGTQKGAI